MPPADDADTASVDHAVNIPTADAQPGAHVSAFADMYILRANVADHVVAGNSQGTYMSQHLLTIARAASTTPGDNFVNVITKLRHSLAQQRIPLQPNRYQPARAFTVPEGESTLTKLIRFH